MSRWLRQACVVGVAMPMLLQMQAVAAGDRALTETAAGFTNVERYQQVDVAASRQALLDRLDGDPDSVFLPGSRLAPPTRALLKLQAAEEAISPARYRIRYGLVQLPNPPKTDPITLSLVQVDRFNLGPALRAALERQHGPESVRAESFANNAHISWRFAMRPVMGTTAVTTAASRADIPHTFAQTMDCLGRPCAAAEITEPPAHLDWQAEQAADWDFETDYAIARNGLPSAATLLDLLLAESGAASRNDTVTWQGFESREGLPEGTPFVDIVIETGLGQDAHIAGLLREDHRMDHETRTQWIHLRAVATTPDEMPVVERSRALISWSSLHLD